MLAGKEKAVCLLNSSDEKKTVLVDFNTLAQAGSNMWERNPENTIDKFVVRDLWEHKDLQLKETSMYIDILPHQARIYRFIRK